MFTPSMSFFNSPNGSKHESKRLTFATQEKLHETGSQINRDSKDSTLRRRIPLRV